MRYWLNTLAMSLHTPPAAELIPRLQARALSRILRNADRSQFVRDHGLRVSMSPQEYQRRVPIRDANQLRLWWDRVAAGEEDVVFNGVPSFFVLTSGTSGVQKRVPVSEPFLKDFRAQQLEVVSWFLRQRPNTQILARKTLTLTGRSRIGITEAGIPFGMMSGVMRENATPLLGLKILPRRETVNLEDWDQKLHAICREVIGQDIGTIAGIPSVILQFLRHAKKAMPEAAYRKLTAGIELLVVSGVNYRLYERQLNEAIGHTVEFMNLYMASEGFMGHQDAQGSDFIRLNPTRLFFEFIPWGAEGVPVSDARLQLHELKSGEDYALAITNGSGAFSYLLGDILRCEDHRGHPLFRLKGRAQLTLNVATEKTSVSALEDTVSELARELGDGPSEFAVAAHLPKDGRKPRYQWVIEACPKWTAVGPFEIARRLERGLIRHNPHYGHFIGTQFDPMEVRFVEGGRFARWLEAHGKQKGHAKVPRIMKDAESLIEL